MWELLRRIAAALERAPSEETLKKLIPLAPLLANLPSEETLKELMAMRATLDAMPKEETLKEFSLLLRESKRDGTLDRLEKMLERAEKLADILKKVAVGD